MGDRLARSVTEPRATTAGSFLWTACSCGDGPVTKRRGQGWQGLEGGQEEMIQCCRYRWCRSAHGTGATAVLEGSAKNELINSCHNTGNELPNNLGKPYKSNSKSDKSYMCQTH